MLHAPSKRHWSREQFYLASSVRVGLPFELTGSDTEYNTVPNKFPKRPGVIQTWGLFVSAADRLFFSPRKCIQGIFFPRVIPLMVLQFARFFANFKSIWYTHEVVRRKLETCHLCFHQALTYFI